MELLLKHGADTETEDKYGYTALTVATKNWSTECVELLLKRGANIEARDEKGYTAMSFATFHGIDAIVFLLERYRKRRDCNWTVLVPLLKCMQIYAVPAPIPPTSSDSSSLSSASSSSSIFAQSIDALLPTIRSYAGYGDIQSDYESGSAACVSFLSSSYARAVIGNGNSNDDSDGSDDSDATATRVDDSNAATSSSSPSSSFPSAFFSSSRRKRKRQAADTSDNASPSQTKKHKTSNR
jgi:hypothetical protein